MALRQWRPARAALLRALEDDPDDPELYARLGYVNVQIGEFGDAVAAFTFAPGSAFYEERGLRAHADALRVTGRAAIASELRTEAIAAAPSAAAAAQLQLDLAQDLRAAGDHSRAEDAVWMALATLPRSERAFTTLAEIALDQGDLPEADAQLWMGGIAGNRLSATHTARARRALAEGDLDEAMRAARKAHRRGRDLTPWAMQAEVLRRLGDPEAGIELLDSGFLADRRRPEMMAARIACLASAGRVSEAEELAREGRAHYPRDSWMLDALNVLAEVSAP